jgi:hypothetical protein
MQMECWNHHVGLCGTLYHNVWITRLAYSNWNIRIIRLSAKHSDR